MESLNKFILLLLGLFVSLCSVFAQKVERSYIRKGNRLYNDSSYIDAEINYRKALEINPKSTVSMYNLGNSLIYQQKNKDALEQYVSASKMEKDKYKLSYIYHNIGVLFHRDKDYKQAIEAYKKALINNPKDDETRYNLSLAQKLLKDEQDNKENNQKENKNNDSNNSSNNNKHDSSKSSQSSERDPKMSKENAEKLLNSVMQDERDVQDRIKKQQKLHGGRLEKDW
ncbi:Photosystem I assembly protein Ycf3 [bioreactor metagenome]|jgi:tetratricopeptide (TPR) repeat protein|uniref:Photosystem I assembly protein Ycf3 n=1 Tax=bioreactor metagenome TaxID=1076179 RepID=A0A644ZPD1_9ZZZZ|nr:tetratricopeptide repeat protein [Bacteroides graminisolvens]MDD3209712.1 tetratricopeptide repeat protein [Bacteroides graminisolvens]MEA4885399.1 tetratricopeptide repeat protein [Bacteroides graminisolvens]